MVKLTKFTIPVNADVKYPLTNVENDFNYDIKTDSWFNHKGLGILNEIKDSNKTIIRCE